MFSLLAFFKCCFASLTLRGRIKDAVETMCMTMWYICCVASTDINIILFYYYLHGNTLVIALHSNAITVVECIQFQEEYT